MSEHAYNVLYTPSNVRGSDGRKVTSLNEELLDSLNVKFIRITWTDWINNIRYRVVPRAYFRLLLDCNRPGIPITNACFGVVGLTVTPGFPSAGEYHYVLDMSSFRLAPYTPGHAVIFGYFQNKVPTLEHGLTVPHCPRTILKRIVERAAHQGGVSYLVGFESEFTLLSATAPKIIPVNNSDYGRSFKLPAGSVEATVMEEIALQLEAAHIELQVYLAEAAPGQVCTYSCTYGSALLTRHSTRSRPAHSLLWKLQTPSFRRAKPSTM